MEKPLQLERLTPQTMAEVSDSREVFVALVNDWYWERIGIMLLQKTPNFWHTAYDHDQTFSDGDIVEIFRIKTPRTGPAEFEIGGTKLGKAFDDFKYGEIKKAVDNVDEEKP